MNWNTSQALLCSMYTLFVALHRNVMLMSTPFISIELNYERMKLLLPRCCKWMSCKFKEVKCMQRTAYRIKRLRTSASELSACTTFETIVRAAAVVALFLQWHFVHSKELAIYSSASCKLLNVARSHSLSLDPPLCSFIFHLNTSCYVAPCKLSSMLETQMKYYNGKWQTSQTTDYKNGKVQLGYHAVVLTRYWAMYVHV